MITQLRLKHPNSLTTPALLFFTQATGLIEFVKQVFERQQTSSFEQREQMPPDRQRGREERRGGRDGGNAVKEQSDVSHRGVPLHIGNPPHPPLPPPLSSPQGKAIHPCPLLLTRRGCTKPGLAICVQGHSDLTLDSRLRVATPGNTGGGGGGGLQSQRNKEKCHWSSKREILGKLSPNAGGGVCRLAVGL